MHIFLTKIIRQHFQCIVFNSKRYKRIAVQLMFGNHLNNRTHCRGMCNDGGLANLFDFRLVDKHGKILMTAVVPDKFLCIGSAADKTGRALPFFLHRIR